MTRRVMPRTWMKGAERGFSSGGQLAMLDDSSQMGNLPHELAGTASGADIMTSRFRFGLLALTWLVTSTDNLAGLTPAPPEQTNRLAHEKLHYLLQHALNPVE